MSEPLQDAKEAVLRFARAWSEWQALMAKVPNSLHDPSMKAAHAKLIADHCTIKKRVYVDGILTYSYPPTYEAVIEENLVHEELCTPAKAHVDFKTPSMYYRFDVQKKRDGWRIDSIKWKVIPSDDWRNGLIGM